MSEARRVQWDQEGVDHVSDHEELTQFLHKKPKTGDMITARYQRANVRLKVVERAGEESSVARVLSITVEDEERVEEHEGLSVDETVLVPDSDRAFLRYDD